MTGIINYFNEMFLGKEELSKKQEMEREAFLSVLNIFGQKGLFDLRSQGAQLEVSYDAPTGICNLKFKFPDSIVRVLGLSKGKTPLVYDSELSCTFSNSRPEETPKIYVCLATTPVTDELGTITISRDGTVIGTNTNFTKYLRGGKRQSRIKVNNKYIFTVSSVEGDSLLYLQGENFPALSNAKFKILPTLSPFSEENNQGIYTYDCCSLTVRTSIPNETELFQIAEFNWSDIVSGLIQGSSSDWFSQKTFMGNFLLPDSVGSEELKPDSVGSEELKPDSVVSSKLDPSLRPVDNISRSSTVSGDPIIVSLASYLVKPSDLKNLWTLTKLQIAPNVNLTQNIGFKTSGFSEISFATYPEELKFIIERLNTDQISGHSVIKVTVEGITFDFPQGAFRTVICFKKNLADLKYEYLYHVNCI